LLTKRPATKCGRSCQTKSSIISRAKI
jgi:hypothetical protein